MSDGLTDRERDALRRRSSRAALRETAREIAALDRARAPGIRASGPAMDAIVRRCLGARPAEVNAIVRQEFDRMVPLLAEAGTYAALLGWQRTAREAASRGIDVRPVRLAYGEKIDALAAKLGITAREVYLMRVAAEKGAVAAFGKAAYSLTSRLAPVVERLASEQVVIGVARKELVAAARAAGFAKASPHTLEMLYRTQMQLNLNAARWESLNTPGLQAVLWGYEYTAVGDDRTRENHLALNGTRLPKDHPLWRSIWPPNGWGCRCSIMAVFDPEPEQMPARGGEPDHGWNFNPALGMPEAA